MACLFGGVVGTASAQSPYEAGRYVAPRYQVPPVPPPPPPLPSRFDPPAAAPTQTLYYSKPSQPLPDIQPTAAQVVQGGDEEEGNQGYQIRLDPPGSELLFRLESEEQLRARIRQEFRDRPEQTAEFPPQTVLSEVAFQGRAFPPSQALREPNYVAYGRLHFQDLNHERYGWDYGWFQPLISAGRFVKDCAILPHSVMSRPRWRFESSAGYCYPGDPVPYLIYPPEITATGLMGQAGVIIAGYAILP